MSCDPWLHMNFSLFNLLIGVEGKYIEYKDSAISLASLDEGVEVNEEDLSKGNSFIVDESLDISLLELVRRIVPISSYYNIVESFTMEYSKFENGFVSHALTGAMRTVIKEYLILIAQIEHQFRSNPTFTLQKFWFYIHPTLITMKTCAELALHIRRITPSSASASQSTAASTKASLADLSNIKTQPPKPTDPFDISFLSSKSANGKWYHKGGGLLGLLIDRMLSLSGSPPTHKLYSYLISQSTVPYLTILKRWIHQGVIVDPYDEFMIVEQKNLKKEKLKEDFSDAYWEERYSFRKGAIPVFLESLKDKILVAGKYLNVMNECGVKVAMQVQGMSDNGKGTKAESEGSVPRNDIAKLVDGSGSYIEEIERAYRFANKSLLDLLMKDNQLMPRLRSLKHYFFLTQSDFLTHFLDLSLSELKKPTSQISLTKLQSLLDLVIRNPASSSSGDEFKEDVKVCLCGVGLIEQLLRIISVDAAGSASETGEKDILGIDAFCLDYSVSFPLSLIISKKTLTKYQLLFRNLFYTKYIERLLSTIWLEDSKNDLWKRLRQMGDRSVPGLERLSGRIYMMRNRMMGFMKQVGYFVCCDVLEPGWRGMEDKMAKAQTVDEVLQVHGDFLDTCLKQCMLTNPKLLRIYSKLLTLCLHFSTFTEKWNKLITSTSDPTNFSFLTSTAVPQPSTYTSTFASSSSTPLSSSLSQSQAQSYFTTTPTKPFSATSEQLPGTPVLTNLGDSLLHLEKSLKKFEDSFGYHLSLLIDALTFYSATESGLFLYLVARLDFSGFYGGNGGSASGV
ncbi:Spc98 family-domain-containing protein [Paraphysoderma sedebokerense]|nr:Spc98 family-domain-containing protein [Paraphysoderma sedebokerense]